MSAPTRDRGIAPALLGAPPLALGAAVADICASTACALHLDILDGVYAGQISFGPALAKAASAASALPVQIHLQTAAPEAAVGVYAPLADLVIVHQEIEADPAALVGAIHRGGQAAGIAIAPGTDVGAIAGLLADLQAVVVMTSAPGTSDYQPSAVPRLTELADIRRRKGLNFVLIADGGITADNAGEIWEAGADQLAAASAVFRHPNGVSAGVRTLEARMHG